MVYKNKGKLKEQNSSRITEPKNRLTATKGKGTVKGGIRVGKKKGGITISMCNVGVGGMGRAYNTEKTSSYSTASYYTDGQ